MSRLYPLDDGSRILAMVQAIRTIEAFETIDPGMTAWLHSLEGEVIALIGRDAYGDLLLGGRRVGGRLQHGRRDNGGAAA
jgi:hypothetical protein